MWKDQENEIRRLKREKSRLVGLLEDPEYEMADEEADTALARLSEVRAEIARLRAEMTAAGTPPHLSRAEQRAAAIEAAIPRLTSFELYISGYPTGRRRYFAEIGDPVEVRMQNAADEKDTATVTLTYARADFIAAVRALAPWEWRSKYIEDDPTDEGMTWEAVLHFEKRRPLVVYGDNGFPYNFDDLLDLFGANTPFDEEEDDSDLPEGLDLDAILADFRAELRELKENRRRRAAARAGMTEEELVASMAAEYAAIYEDALANGMDIMLVGDGDNEDGEDEE